MKISLRYRSRGAGSTEHGYILIALILFVALLAISMLAMAPLISQQVKRDREEELIHRGVQYSRAIKHYVKKFGRYPTKLEDLENTNNVRFLRKRYKDPITGKDFKLLHLGEVQMSFGGGVAGATSAASLASASQGAGSNSAFGGNSSFGGNSGFGNSGFGNNSSFGGGSFGGNNSGSFGGNSFGGNNPGGGFGSSFGGNTFGNNSSQTPSGGTNPPQGTAADAGQANAAGNSDQSQNASGAPGSPGTPGQPGQGNQVFGGGPIVGVASISKDKSIRVFNKKEHYYQWQFIYDPSTDTGGLLSTPNQPGLQSLAGGGMQQGIPGQPGAQNSPFGNQNSPFGNQGSAFGNSGSPFGAPGGNPTSPGGMQQAQPQMPQSQFPPDQGPPP
jgi:type II secretory pathway pseudopilin PulG